MNLHILIFVATIASTRIAVGQPTTASASGDALFDQAQALMDQGKFAEACAVFEASEKATSTVTTMLSIGNCREQNKQLATAYGWYRQVERRTRGPVDEDFAKRHRFAKEHAQALVDRLSKLTVEVAPDRRVPGLEVLRNKEPVEVGAWGQPVPVDGGTYEIVVRAPDHEPWRTVVVIDVERDAETVSIPKLVAKPKPIVLRPRSRTPFYLGGGAIALGIGALAFELSGQSAYSKSEREPVAAERSSLFESAKRQRYIAQALGAVAVGAAGVAVWLYLRDGKARTRAVEVTPMVSPGTVGLAVDGRW